MKLSISRGNRKMGRVANISLPPIKTCKPRLDCHKYCYAKRAYAMYPNTRKCYDGNLELWQKDPASFEAQLSAHLNQYSPKYFRFHVSGDVPSKDYGDMMKRVAKKHWGTNFLVFTKKEHSIKLPRPHNLTVVHSWYEGRDSQFYVTWQAAPRAFIADKNSTDKEIQKNFSKFLAKNAKLVVCVGSCVDCRACWELGMKDIVVFRKH